jgi:NaMN:DMB phosphoribosyltransferase
MSSGKRVAVLLDGGFVYKRLYALLGKKLPLAKDILGFAHKCVADDVTADTDFVPAMKLARREGVQVILVPMQTRMLNKAMRAHADEVRTVNP